MAAHRQHPFRCLPTPSRRLARNALLTELLFVPADRFAVRGLLCFPGLNQDDASDQMRFGSDALSNSPELITRRSVNPNLTEKGTSEMESFRDLVAVRCSLPIISVHRWKLGAVVCSS